MNKSNDIYEIKTHKTEAHIYCHSFEGAYSISETVYSDGAFTVAVCSVSDIPEGCEFINHSESFITPAAA